jgi:hypothetical protein
MKAYKTELSHFFSHKKDQDAKLKRALAHKTFEEKKEIVSEYRASTLLDQGVYSINSEHQFERKPFIRDIYYLEKLNDDIKFKQTQFNKYKYDTLYDLVEFDESIYDSIDAEIVELKRKREEYISKRSKQNDDLIDFNEKIALNIKVRIEEFNDAELTKRKEIYRNIIDLKKLRFEKLEPRLSMIHVDKLFTLITDYLPIRGHERNVLNLNASPEEVVITPDVLEEPRVGLIKMIENSKNSQSNEE